MPGAPARKNVPRPGYDKLLGMLGPRTSPSALLSPLQVAFLPPRHPGVASHSVPVVCRHVFTAPVVANLQKAWPSSRSPQEVPLGV